MQLDIVCFPTPEITAAFLSAIKYVRVIVEWALSPIQWQAVRKWNRQRSNTWGDNLYDDGDADYIVGTAGSLCLKCSIATLCFAATVLPTYSRRASFSLSRSSHCHIQYESLTLFSLYTNCRIQVEQQHESSLAGWLASEQHRLPPFSSLKKNQQRDLKSNYFNGRAEY